MAVFAVVSLNTLTNQRRTEMTHPAVCSKTGVQWQPTELVNAILSRHCRSVVRHWISHERYLDAANEPRLLQAYGSGEDGFDRLVYRCNPHLSPTVVRNELLRKGVVELSDDGCLLLRRSTYIPGKNPVVSYSGVGRLSHARAS